MLDIPEFYSDIEYREFPTKDERWNKKFDNIDNMQLYMSIDEEVMYLDYIYDFYNFGEFWDCINRLLVSKLNGVSNLPLFHLSYNRVTDIKHYFDKLNFKWPTNYQIQQNNCKLYWFKKINISVINGVWRGYYDQFYAYNFNTQLNPYFDQPTSNKYNLYLARGKFGRSLVGEEQIVSVLKSQYNFTVLDGSESLDQIMYYFSNANIILGAHGSLMKNIIWCLNNPIFIELCPLTRHDCFKANAINCRFTTFFFTTESDDKEQIILNEKQIDGLYKLLDLLLANQSLKN